MLNIDAYVIIFHLSDHIFRVYNLAANIFLITFKIDNESIFRSLSRLCWNFYVKINVNVIMILKLHGVRNKLSLSSILINGCPIIFGTELRLRFSDCEICK